MRTPILLAATLALGACASQSPASAAPASTSATRLVRGSVTLRVVNTTGSSFTIHASPDLNPPIPQPSSGLMVLGKAAPGTTCIVLPASFDEYATNVTTGHTDTLTWVSSMPLTIIAYDSGSSASTGDFVLDTAAGWTITLPGPEYPLQISRDSPCTPS